MAAATFTFTTPIARGSQVGVDLGTSIGIGIDSLIARFSYLGRTATGPIPGPTTELVVQLTAGDAQAILGLIVARAIANGQGIPAGTMTVT